MKTLTLFLLLTTTSFAADYTCRAGLSKLELQGTDERAILTSKDAQSGQIYYMGFVRELISLGNTTDLMFDTGAHKLLQLRFKTVDLENEADKLYGFAKGHHGGGFVDQSIQCFKVK